MAVFKDKFRQCSQKFKLNFYQDPEQMIKAMLYKMFKISLKLQSLPSPLNFSKRVELKEAVEFSKISF